MEVRACYSVCSSPQPVLIPSQTSLFHIHPMSKIYFVIILPHLLRFSNGLFILSVSTKSLCEIFSRPMSAIFLVLQFPF